MQLYLGKLDRYWLAVARCLQCRVGKYITFRLSHQFEIVKMLKHVNLISLASLRIHRRLVETGVYQVKLVSEYSKLCGDFPCTPIEDINPIANRRSGMLIVYTHQSCMDNKHEV